MNDWLSLGVADSFEPALTVSVASGWAPWTRRMRSTLNAPTMPFSSQ